MEAKSLAIKIALGLTGAGGVGVLAHQGYQAFNNEKKQEKFNPASNKEQIEGVGYTILSKESASDGDWNKILTSYKQADSNLKFADFDGQDTASALSTLKNKCDEALNSKNSELLSKAKKWCVTPVKPSALLEKRGLKALKTETNQAEDEKKGWTERLNAFKLAKQGNSELGKLIELVEGDQKDAENIVKMKTKCKEFDSKVSHEKGFEENLKNIELWCIDRTKINDQ